IDRTPTLAERRPGSRLMFRDKPNTSVELRVWQLAAITIVSEQRTRYDRNFVHRTHQPETTAKLYRPGFGFFPFRRPHMSELGATAPRPARLPPFSVGHIREFEPSQPDRERTIPKWNGQSGTSRFAVPKRLWLQRCPPPSSQQLPKYPQDPTG